MRPWSGRWTTDQVVDCADQSSHSLVGVLLRLSQLAQHTIRLSLRFGEFLHCVVKKYLRLEELAMFLTELDVLVPDTALNQLI
jgi:hypothetical protein